MTLTSSTRSTPGRFSKSQVALISWMWWLNRCNRYPFMGSTFLLGKTSPTCSLLSMKTWKMELIITAR